MSVRRSSRAVLLGLGVIAGAVLPARVRAQVPVKRDTVQTRRDTLPTRVDSTRARTVRPPEGRDTLRVPTPPRADTMLKNDSLAQGIVPLPQTPKPDTIKPPLAHAEGPPVLEIGAARVYDRSALFATGALRLSDLLGRVPGATELAAGWHASPAVVASMGDLRRVRIFLDGLELDPLDRRARGIAAPNDLPLHALEELRIERGAEEIRVYATSWRVDRTDPYTRADIGTGDQNTNLYRAFFGRRYDRGEVLQLSAEQSGTQPDNRLPSSSELHVMARVGTVRGPWKGDLFAERSDRDRAPWTGIGNSLETLDTIPGQSTRRTTAYARLANGDPDVGRWLQLLLASESFRGSPRTSNAFGASPGAADSVPDSTSYENQYLLTGGVTRGSLRVSAAERARMAAHRTSHTLSARASWTHPWVGVSLFAEGSSPLTPARLEGTARVAPFDRVALLVSASRTGGATVQRLLGDRDTATVSELPMTARTNVRAEAGIRLYDVWLSGGVLRRGPATLLPPADFAATYAKDAAIRTESEAMGGTASIRGRLYKALNVDAWAVAWNDSTGLYRPKYQTRSELYIQTNLLDRFPRGNFGLLASLAHEYRSNVRFATGDGAVRTAEGFRTLAFKLEIRIQTAVVSYQFRNLLQDRYAEVPGHFMPRQTQFYGVRWDFWN